MSEYLNDKYNTWSWGRRNAVRLQEHAVDLTGDRNVGRQIKKVILSPHSTWPYSYIKNKRLLEILWPIIRILTYCSFSFFPHGAAALSGREPHPGDFTTILRHSVGLLWTSDQPFAEISTRTTQNTCKRHTSMSPAVFEPTVPTNERPQTDTLDRAESAPVSDEQWNWHKRACEQTQRLRNWEYCNYQMESCLRTLARKINKAVGSRPWAHKTRRAHAKETWNWM
jgi:hypothetical protein